MDQKQTQLLKRKEKIDDTKSTISELEGRKKYLLEELGKQGCKTVAEAEKKSSTMEKGITKLSDQINVGLQEIEEEYPNV